ncbi:hypothetical protein PoB_002276700 [Plakobranchus ocellatus]|uniref:Uncharacterized protein n=1 Tax=Plakobranchus ocellatus TaxID=259542 RepID=A0AAV3ZP21_9GAST|nr:hypothetical protein PoB_002276700 [Plakobranchus ocellatus]
MLIFLLTTLATLSIHTACAYSSNGLYGRGDRDTLEEVIDSLTRPSHRDQEDSIDLDDFLTLLGRISTYMYFFFYNSYY